MTRDATAFVQWAWDHVRDGSRDIDALDVQEHLHDLGLLKKIQVTEPCGEGCVCAEYDDITPEHPATCYRPTWKATT